MSPCGPPRLAEALLRRLMHPDDREWAVGDLHEEHARIAAVNGRACANAWYWTQVVRGVPASLRRRAQDVTALPDVLSTTRLAGRSLARRPGLTLTAVATLAVGIGAAAAIFSVSEAVLLRPLPFRDGARLVQVWNTYDSWRGHEVLDAYWNRIALSYPEYVDWRQAQESFDDVAIYATTRMTLTGNGDPDRVRVGLASPSLFPLLGADMRLGRGFAPQELGPDAPRLAVLSHEAWIRRFGGAPSVLGDRVTLAGMRYTVVGVLERGFRLRPLSEPPGDRERHAVWVPVGALGEELDRGNHRYEALGRLAHGVTLQRAVPETGALLRGAADPTARGARLTFRKVEEVGGMREPLLLLSCAVGLLLAIACGNVALLLVSDIARRRRDLATRVALGAGAGRIFGHLALEALLLGAAGGSLGALGAAGGVALMPRLAPNTIPIPAGLGMEIRTILLSLAVGLAAGAVLGLAAGVVVRRGAHPRDVSGRFAHQTRPGRRLQRAVLGSQVAVSMVLLVSGSLLTRSLAELRSVRPGFDPESALTARVSLSSSSYAQADATAFFHGVAERLEAAPGVRAATWVSAMPFSGRDWSSSFQIVGREVPPDQKQPEAHRRAVRFDYHRALGIPLVAGRRLTAADRVGDRPVILISEAMARRYWPAGDALGRRISRDRREFEIVGIVADVLHEDLAGEAKPTFYVPLDVAEGTSDMTLFARTDLEASAAADVVRRAVWAVDDDIPVEEISSAEALLASSTEQQRFRSWLMATFALAATALCAVGLFGATAREVTARTRELGIRRALGERRGCLVRRVALEDGAALGAGLVSGITGALLAGSLLERFLFRLRSIDPESYGLALVVLAAVGGSAILLAATRAVRLDPVVAIRTE